MSEGDYITSVVLRDYCLGLLTREEQINVEAMCRDNRELAAELRLLRQALEQYAGSDEILHRTELRKAVWDRIQKMWEDKNA